MTFLALLLIAATAALGLARLLRLPAVPLLLIAGVTIPQLGIDIPPDLLQNTLELGLMVLVFIAGVELSPRRFKGRGRIVFVLATVQFLGIGAAGYLFARLLGYETTQAVFLAFALSASSTIIVIRLLKQRQQMFEPFGRLVTGALLLQDLFIIVVIVVLLKWGDGLSTVGTGLVALIGLAALAAVVQRWLGPWAIRKIKPDDEILLLLVLTQLFVFCGLAWALDLPLIAGAFLGGFSLSGFPVNDVARGVLLSLGDFFLVLFFTALGATLVMPGWTMLGHGALFAIFLVLLTVPLVAVIAESAGVSARSAIESGLLLAQTSEFSLILALYGLMDGQLDRELFSMIALLTVATMTATSFIASDQVTWRLMRLHPLYRRTKRLPQTPGGHVVVLGYGGGMDQTVKPIQNAGIPVLVVDDDPAVVRRLLRSDTPSLKGDASDPRTLELAGARQARIVLCSLRRASDAYKVLEYLHGSRVRTIVRVFDEDLGREVERRGGTAIVSTRSTVNVFFRWMRENGYID